MARHKPTCQKQLPICWYRGADVPLRVIRRFAEQIAEQFDPEKIILFGSYASGTPHKDSDVDIIVIMPARNQIDMACRIDAAIDPPFPLDLLVRTPQRVADRLAEGEAFTTEIMTKGKVLYEKSDRRLGTQGRSGLLTRRPNRSRGRSVSRPTKFPLPAGHGKVSQGNA